jgi:exodeoxyribonuclease VII small subunit
MPKKPQPLPQSFEEALAELEKILSNIESGQVGLEESLVQYERGSFLVQHCRAVLDKAEKQIELLSKSEAGGLQSQPLEDEDAPETE